MEKELRSVELAHLSGEMREVKPGIAAVLALWIWGSVCLAGEPLLESLFPAAKFVDHCAIVTYQFAKGKYGPEARARIKAAYPIPDKLIEDHLLSSMREGLPHFRKLLEGYPEALDGAALEVGPLYQPLVPHGRGKRARTFYWDMDVAALLKLAADERGNPRPDVTAQFIDLNSTNVEFLTAFRKRTRDRLALEGKDSFKAVVVSQVLNYVDVNKFLPFVAEFQKSGDFLFINNPRDAGDLDFLHPNRPRTHVDLLKAIEAAGYEMKLKEKPRTIDGDYIQIVAVRK